VPKRVASNGHPSQLTVPTVASPKKLPTAARSTVMASRPASRATASHQDSKVTVNQPASAPANTAANRPPPKSLGVPNPPATAARRSTAVNHHTEHTVPRSQLPPRKPGAPSLLLQGTAARTMDMADTANHLSEDTVTRSQLLPRQQSTLRRHLPSTATMNLLPQNRLGVLSPRLLGMVARSMDTVSHLTAAGVTASLRALLSLPAMEARSMAASLSTASMVERGMLSPILMVVQMLIMKTVASRRCARSSTPRLRLRWFRKVTRSEMVA
jgi:hypothetical protein